MARAQQEDRQSIGGAAQTQQSARGEARATDTSDGAGMPAGGRQRGNHREMHTSAIHIPRDTYERLQDAAFYRAKEKKTRFSVSALITEVAEEWLDGPNRRSNRGTDGGRFFLALVTVAALIIPMAASAGNFSDGFFEENDTYVQRSWQPAPESSPLDPLIHRFERQPSPDRDIPTCGGSLFSRCGDFNLAPLDDLGFAALKSENEASPRGPRRA